MPEFTLVTSSGCRTLGSRGGATADRCSMNHSCAAEAAASRVPGSSNRCVAPGTIAMRCSQRSLAAASWLSRSTTASSPPTINNVGASTAARRRRGKVGPAATRHDRRDRRVLARRPQCRARPGTGAEVADGETVARGLPPSPPRRGEQPNREELDVEHVCPLERFVGLTGGRTTRSRAPLHACERPRTGSGGCVDCSRSRARRAPGHARHAER